MKVERTTQSIMQSCISLVVVFIAFFVVLAPGEPLPCGTTVNKENHEYLLSMIAKKVPLKARDEWIYILTKNHVFKNSQGTAAITENELQEQMNITNGLYAANKIKFLSLYTNYITSDEYYNYVNTGNSDDVIYNTYGDKNAINIFWAKTGIKFIIIINPR
jgi:hypothetical protein